VEQKKRIALIDDEHDFCFFVSQMLEKTGRFSVSVANDGAEGLTLLRREKPDLVLLDVMMPKVSGPDLADTIVRDQELKDIPLVFVTALVTEEEVGFRLMKEIGGRNFIAKPVENDQLIACIDRMIALRSERDKQ
jgi:CheY-like chemotaxis protein